MKHTAKTFVMGLATAAFSHAAIVVNYDADINTTTYTFNDSQNLTPQVTVDHGTINVAYKEVNGAHASIQSHGAAGLRVRNQDSDSGTVGVGAVGVAGTALFAFDLGGTYAFAAGADDDFTIRTGANNDRIDTGTGSRLSLLNAGTWYVSETIHTSSGITSGDALSLDWFAVLDITTVGLDTIDGTVVDPATFNSITMMGAYVHLVAKEDVGGNSSSNFGVQDLILNAQVVPEPSSAALLGLGGLALILRRRK